MDDDPVLRNFERRDQEGVRRLVLDGLGEHWGEVNESLNHDLNDITGTHANGRTIVAALDQVVIGTGTIVPRDREVAEILRMSVASPFRRSGVGQRIVEELVETARAWSSSRVVLETSSSWTEVIAFYLACGFDVTGQREGEFGQDTWFATSI